MSFVVRLSVALIGGAGLMILAATVGAIISPGAHGLPVVITGAVAFVAGFVPVWIWNPEQNW